MFINKEKFKPIMIWPALKRWHRFDTNDNNPNMSLTIFEKQKSLNCEAIGEVVITRVLDQEPPCSGRGEEEGRKGEGLGKGEGRREGERGRIRGQKEREEGEGRREGERGRRRGEKERGEGKGRRREEKQRGGEGRRRGERRRGGEGRYYVLEIRHKALLAWRLHILLKK